MYFAISFSNRSGVHIAQCYQRFAFRVAANDADTLKDELSVTRKEVKRLIPYLSKLAQIVLLLDEEIILYERLNGSRRQNKFN